MFTALSQILLHTARWVFHQRALKTYVFRFRGIGHYSAFQPFPSSVHENEIHSEWGAFSCPLIGLFHAYFQWGPLELTAHSSALNTRNKMKHRSSPIQKIHKVASSLSLTATSQSKTNIFQFARGCKQAHKLLCNSLSQRNSPPECLTAYSSPTPT